VSDQLADQLERSHPTELTDLVMTEAEGLYDARSEQFTPPVMRMVERYAFINALDRLWIEHLEAMDSLRSGIGLRAVGQKDPLVEYKREGFRMFKQLMGLLEAEVATTIFKVQVQAQAAPVDAPVETALTRAAEQSSTNAPVDGVAVAAGGNGSGSRAERRSKPQRVGAVSATKKRKKRR